MSNCAITTILNKVEKGTKGKPSYTFFEKKRLIQINYGAGFKAKDLYQANQIAVSKSEQLNKIVNSEVFLDNIFIPNQNFIEIVFSDKYLKGMERLEQLKNDYQDYKEFMESEEGNSGITEPLYMSDYEKSDEALREQELKESMDIIDEYLSNGEVKQICEL